MLATVVWDVYHNDERREILRAIKELIPDGSPDWSRKGIYAYWDPETRNLLYVGLATDLLDRFAQHNRLVSHSGGNKADAIDTWFATHRRLGFSLLIQSAAVQSLDMLYHLSPTLGVESDDISRTAEGQLIELHRMEHGQRPPWNGVGGSVRGAEWATHSARPIVRLLSAQEQSLFVARCTLRKLAANTTYQRFEALIHAARMRTLLDQHDFESIGALSEAEMVDRITRFLMLRDGKLIDDFGDMDAQIRNWVMALADSNARTAERECLLYEVEDLPDDVVTLSDDTAALNFIATLIASDADEQIASDALEVLNAGYLDNAPNLDEFLARTADDGPDTSVR